jgi:hypothetical protein
MFKDVIMGLILDTSGTGSAAPTSDASPPAPDIADQIKKLAELCTAGVLNSEEFESKKTELLARM